MTTRIAFLGGGNMGKQLKYADKRAAPVAVPSIPCKNPL